MAAKGPQQSRQGQSVREKFFLDFVSATTKSSDPFGQTKSEKVQWLPELLFVESAEQAREQSVFQPQALLDEARDAFRA